MTCIVIFNREDIAHFTKLYRDPVHFYTGYRYGCMKQTVLKMSLSEQEFNILKEDSNFSKSLRGAV